MLYVDEDHEYGRTDLVEYDIEAKNKLERITSLSELADAEQYLETHNSLDESDLVDLLERSSARPPGCDGVQRGETVNSCRSNAYYCVTHPRTKVRTRPTVRMSIEVDPTISLIENDSGTWTAIDGETGVASQGETREKALDNLDEAVALHNGEIGEPVTDDDLRELGLDPDAVPDEPAVPDAPWFDDE